MMRFEIHNVGMVRQADIELRGLTVIAGENDTGKSTIGKLLFSIVRAFTKHEEMFEEGRNEFIETITRVVYIRLRDHVDFEEKEELRALFGKVLRENGGIFRERNVEKIARILHQIHEQITPLPIDDTAKAELLSVLHICIELCQKDPEDLFLKKQSLNKVLSSAYDNQISNYFESSETTVNGFDGSNRIFSATIQPNNEVGRLEIFDTLSYNEALYIESPYVLKNGDMEDDQPFHVTDLLTRLRNKSKASYSIVEALIADRQQEQDFNQQISTIIGGSLDYNKDRSEFFFRKQHNGNNLTIKLGNIATGIKAFGIVQMLLEAKALHSQTLLIIDEPEVHLHPTWQVEYAKLLVLLAKAKNLNILLTSHSPYFIEAIKVYSDKYSFAPNTKFYLAKKNESGSSDIFNVTDELELIFEKLSEPFDR